MGETVNNSFEQVAQSKHFWVDVDLERNAGHIFPLEAFLPLFSMFCFVFCFAFLALCELLTRMNQRHLELVCHCALGDACVRVRGHLLVHTEKPSVI